MNKVLINNMLGKMFPFFLGNYNLSDSYYLYQFCSPSLNDCLEPTISMTKVGEKTRKDIPCGHDIDILTVCKGSENEVDYLKNVLKKIETEVVENGQNFPKIDMVDDLTIQKTMLITLRDDLRWKNYRFFPGRKIDVLWTPFEYVVFNLAADKENMWLEPVAAYKNYDVEMTIPLAIDLNSLDYPKEKWVKSSNTKASEINKMIKKLEWGAFDRRALTKKLQ